MENIENLIIEHLRHIRGRVDLISDGMGDLKHRLGQLELQTAHSRRDQLAVQEDVYRQQGAIDGIKGRLDRIERRLELQD